MIVTALGNFMIFILSVFLLVLLIFGTIDLIIFIILASLRYIISSVYSIRQYNTVIQVLHSFKNNKFGDYMRFVKHVDKK